MWVKHNYSICSFKLFIHYSIEKLVYRLQLEDFFKTDKKNICVFHFSLEHGLDI